MEKLSHDFSDILTNLHDGLYFVNIERRITYWNTAAERITGFKTEEVIGSFCSDNILIHVDNKGNELCKCMCPLARTMQDGTPRETDVFLHHKNGHRVPVTVRVTALHDDKGNIIGGIELFSDSSHQEVLRSKIASLEKLALLDTLTELPNRRQIEADLVAQVMMFERMKIPFSVVLFDIDNFKSFNDDYGHDVGDLALQTVAKTISASARVYDIIGRWGGEEFLGVFPNTDLKLLGSIANKLCMLIRHTRVETLSGPLNVTISVGGTSFTNDDTIDTLLKRADTLMYESKKAGRNRVTIG